MDDRYGQLLLAALRGEPVRIPGRLNPDLLFWKLCEHGLAGLLADVHRRGPVVSLPEFADRVRPVAVAQEASVASNLRAAREIAAALRRRDIPAVFVKGAALSLTVYERPALRPFGDLDLLVAPDRVAAAGEALASVGYRPDPDEVPSAMETTWRREDAGALPVELDLHWDFTESDRLQAAVRIPVPELLQRRREAETLPIPALEDSLLLASANLIRSRVDRMILVVDFARMTAAGPDWDAVLSRATAWRLRTALWLGLSLAERLFGAAPPERVKSALAPPAWRRRCIRGLLAGSSLWSRRKVRHRVVAYGLPLLCADSFGDITRALGAGRGRVLAKLGFPGPRGG